MHGRHARSLFLCVGGLALASCGSGSTNGARSGEPSNANGSGDDAGISLRGDDGGTADDSGSIPSADDAGPGSSQLVTDASTPDGGPGAGGKGADGGAVHVCKRGVAANATPSAALAPTASMPGVSWWYNWADHGSAPPSGIEFVPMIWGSATINDALPAGSRYVLGFNEPNFKTQSNLTYKQAAADWPPLETHAKAAGASIVSPGVNFCSATAPVSCSDVTVTDPYTYIRDFLSACPGCEVDYVAAHWYNCDLPSLQAYIEGNLDDAGQGLEGFVQFGKPIWLTEFACDGSHSAAEQKTYMEAAIPYLESNPHVFRYSWFSSTAIATSVLMNTDGSLTDLGKTYVGLPQNCP